MAMPGLSELNAQAADLVGRIKPSERRLLALLLLVGLVALLVKSFDLVETAQARNDDAQAGLALVQKTLARGQGGIASRVAETMGQVRTWSWQADSVDVGKVLIQSDIARLADKAGLAEADVKVGEKLATAGDVRLVPVELTAPFTWPGLSGFLTGLNDTGKGFILDQVQLPDDDKPRLKLVLRAPLMITPPKPRPAAKTLSAGTAAGPGVVRP